jgi:hypothetical protein
MTRCDEMTSRDGLDGYLTVCRLFTRRTVSEAQRDLDPQEWGFNELGLENGRRGQFHCLAHTAIFRGGSTSSEVSKMSYKKRSISKNVGVRTKVAISGL